MEIRDKKEQLAISDKRGLPYNAFSSALGQNSSAW